jgi:hypothetical protein
MHRVHELTQIRRKRHRTLFTVSRIMWLPVWDTRIANGASQRDTYSLLETTAHRSRDLGTKLPQLASLH